MQTQSKDWTNIFFLCGSPVIGVLGTALYALRYGIVWWEPVLCLALFMAVGLSVGAGYHRYYAHRTYECHPVVQATFLFFGALALQNSVLKWARDHRDHHKYVDRDWDPYNINRGAWYAHILWIFYKEDAGRDFKNVPDLTKNRLVMLQSRGAAFLGIVVGLGLPTLVGAFFGRPLGGLLWGGFLRIVLVHHTTFFINSLAHLWGKRPYSEESSARDNWLLAFFTHGEGYHNFHHKFPSDFRNGIRWWQWDPSKWLIRGLGRLRLARALRSTPPPMVAAAHLEVERARASRLVVSAAADLRERIDARFEAARKSLNDALDLWNEMLRRRREIQARDRATRRAAMAELRAKMEQYRASFRAAQKEWRVALSLLTPSARV